MSAQGHANLRTSHWQFRPLGEVFEIVGGGTPSKKVAAYYGGDIPWATIRDMHSEELSSTEHTITDAGLKSSSAKLIPSGEVVMASRVGLGKACILNQATAINQDIRALLPLRPEQIERRFCLYWLQSIADQICSAGSGATVQGIKLPFIKSLRFPSIPLDEQKRIVAVLDQAFAALDRARAHAEANLAAATSLFEAGLDQIFCGARDSWSSEKLSDLCVIGDGNHSSKYPKTSDMVRMGIPFIRSSNIQDGYIDTIDMLFISVAKHNDLKKGHLHAGDILFTNRGEIGKVALVPEELDGSNLNSQVAWLRCKEKIDKEFLYFFLQSGSVRQHLSSNKSGAALQQFTIKMIKSLEVGFPNKVVQREAVDRMKETRRLSQRLISNYRSAISDIADLRQSLLQKAFSGQLT